MYNITLLDEYNQPYPIESVNTLQEVSDLLESIDIQLETATGWRYNQLQSMYNELREQLS